MNRLLPLLLALALFSGCISLGEEDLPQEEEETVYLNEEYFEVLDYKGKAEGGEIPPWAERFMSRGERAVEDLYIDSYVFIASNGGSNFRALSQWAAAFSAEQDLPRLVQTRIEARLERDSENPAELYGEYYEELIRAAADTVYLGAAKADDFWVKRRFSGEDRLRENQEAWEFFVLVTVKKSFFVPQVEAMLSRIGEVKAQGQPARQQRSAFNSLRANFFARF